MQRIAVIGLGRFGQHIARALTAAEAEVIAIDRDAALIEQMRDEVTLAVRLDSTDEAALRAQGIHEVDVAIVGIGVDFESAALTVATLKALPVKRIIARAQTEIQGKILSSVGADEIVSPELESAQRWAHRLMVPSIKQYLELGEGHGIIYMMAPIEFQQQTLQGLDLRNQYGVNLIAIERRVAVATDPKPAASPAPVILIPTAETTILPDDLLILVGSDESLDHLPHVDT